MNRSGAGIGVVRLKGLAERHGGWHVEVRSGWKTYAATLCGLQLPNEFLERDAQVSRVTCSRCQDHLAEQAAQEEARAQREKASAARGDAPEAPAEPTDNDQGSLF